MNDLTDKDVGNILSHVPKAVRPYIDKLMPRQVLIEYCAKIKSREMSRKDLIVILGGLLREYLTAEKARAGILDGFAVGDIKTCSCEYWHGKEVEIVEIDNTDCLPIRATYNGTIYRFHPDWFMK